MKAYKALVKFALSQGCTVSVYDGEVWGVRRSVKYQQIVECIESVEEAALIIRDSEGNKLAWALVQPFGLEDNETLVDNTMTPFMEKFDMLQSAKL